MGIVVDKKYGGSEADSLALSVAVEEISRYLLLKDVHYSVAAILKIIVGAYLRMMPFTLILVLLYHLSIIYSI